MKKHLYPFSGSGIFNVVLKTTSKGYRYLDIDPSGGDIYDTERPEIIL